ncbi:MAG: isoprenylcysteine carboxylmethyltransferase family protein [Candidatus Aminicenantes bacterium]|nr:isoprenylcysteine carboxylmethyltransferase family protein [Candidatus Aminicenantes bacterium]
MTKSVIGAGLVLLIWLVNGYYIIQGIRNRVRCEVYMHIGLGLFFSQVVTASVWGNLKLLWSSHFDWLEIIGVILNFPAFILVLASLATLKHQGKPKGHDMTATTTLIQKGIYCLIRQPMTLGMAIWSLAQILMLQSLVSLIIGLLAFFCFFQSARLESELNKKKFGDAYLKYMESVPMWNLFRSMKNYKQLKFGKNKQNGNGQNITKGERP